MDNDEMEVNVCSELSNRLKESEKSHMVFGFSHIIIVDSITNIMDTSFRTVIDGMFRRTKLHCKTEEEAELYRQNLCKLYLSYIQKGIANIESLEPKLSKILAVEEKNPIENVKDQITSLKTKVAKQTKRVQSLLALQSRLRENTVLSEWIISKLEPTVHDAEHDFANMQSEAQDIESMISELNDIKDSVQSFVLN